MDLFSFHINDQVRHQSVVKEGMSKNIIYSVNNYHSSEKSFWCITAQDDQIAKSWEMEDLYVIDTRRTFTGHSSSVRYACSNLDDTEICSCCLDHSVRIWDEKTAQTKAILVGHRGNVVYADYVDNKTIVTASWDQTIKVFRLP